MSFKTYSYEIEESGYPSIANGSLIDLKDDSGNKINGEYIAALIKKEEMKNPFEVNTPEGISAQDAYDLFVDVFTDFYQVPKIGHTF